MPKSPRGRRSLADRICEAVKELTTHRQSRAYAAQWISVGEIQAHLGVDEAAIDTAVRKAAERWRLKTAGEPVQSISRVYGWDED